MLAGPRHVVTCAHVVNAALGLDPRTQGMPSSPVRVDFPLLGSGAEAAALEAVVKVWLPPPREGAAGDDLAGLVLTGRLPDRAVAGRLAVETARPGQQVRVFGYPGIPPRPDGAWVSATMRGAVGNGRLQLDSGPESALRVQPGFSGGPVCDDGTGRVVGLVAAAPGGHAADRDSYAISSDTLRDAWPEVLEQPERQNRGRDAGQLTILHISDFRFGGERTTSRGRAEPAEHPLFRQLHEDLSGLADEHGLRPDLAVVTGSLAEEGLRREFLQSIQFLNALTDAAEVPRRQVAIVPGTHDVNRRECARYFERAKDNDEEPVPPYWPKWQSFADMFTEFYEGTADLAFTPDEPWTLFEMPDISTVVAGLNSTMADSHRPEDHHGWIGERQLRWFADRLADYRRRGWLRIAAVHHPPVGEHLRDAADLDRFLGHHQLANVLLHGCFPEGKSCRLPSGLVALPPGGGQTSESCPADAAACQYQLITVRPDGFTRYARRYEDQRHRWVYDTRISATWPVRVACQVTDADAVLSPRTPPRVPESAESSQGSELLERVAEATRVRYPGAAVTVRPEGGYMRVWRPLPGGGAEPSLIGVVEGEVTQAAVEEYASGVHAQYASAGHSVRSELVYGGTAAPAELVRLARRRSVRLRSFVQYQGLLDFRPLAEAQRERLAADRIYPAQLYVEQRYKVISGAAHRDRVRTGLIQAAVDWLSSDVARLIVVLGDFGRGKTSFLRQLTRVLPSELPDVTPVLVELRTLEKGPSLDDLLAQHLLRQGVEDLSRDKLRYMIESGRVVLLFDGFDELELRVGYDSASDYLQTLVNSLTGQAKVILTSRTQHFRDSRQVRTALGERVETRTGGRVVILEDFTEGQILLFLTNLYEGDRKRAERRLELISDIGNLLELTRNPRMLAFVAQLREDRLLGFKTAQDRISAADLYSEIIEFWLATEEERQRHRRGLARLSKDERLAACTELALRMWRSNQAAISLRDLSAAVSATLARLAERGFSEDQAAHSIASGSLLVRTEEGAFAFVHQSVMEWLVAAQAARGLSEANRAQILTAREMSRLMVAFFTDIAGHDAARRWAAATLADSNASGAAKQNALAVESHLEPPPGSAPAGTRAAPQNLAGVDVRNQDLNGRDLRHANLRGANLSGMRLCDTDLTDADLTGADLSGIVMTRGSLRNATFAGSRWHRAAILGTEGREDLHDVPELAAAAIAGRDPAEPMTDVPGHEAQCVTFSPDGSLLAYGSGNLVKIADADTGKTLRIFRGHDAPVLAVTFSPDGTLIATASGDGTARISDSATGRLRLRLTGHDYAVTAVAFSPDGARLATASGDRTARVWDVTSGFGLNRLAGHDYAVNAVAFSPDGTLIATGSEDHTVRLWDAATGTPLRKPGRHGGPVTSVAFSPDGTLVASASSDRTTRIWETSISTYRTALTGHGGPVNDVAFSPDGALIATASSDGTACTWDTSTGTRHATLTGHDKEVTAVAFSPGGALIATASIDRTVRTWDANGSLQATLTGQTRQVTALSFASTATIMATASEENAVRVWDASTAITVPAKPVAHGRPVTAVACSPDGSLVATASWDGTARIWNVGTGKAEIFSHNASGRAVAFSLDGALLATASADTTAHIWDVATRKRLATLSGHDARVHAIAFSPGTTLIATASADRTARVWDASTGTQRAVLTGHTDTVNAVAFSPDSSFIATASHDGTARIWQPPDLIPSPTRRLPHRRQNEPSAPITVRGHQDALTSLDFSPDGAWLAIGSLDGTVRLWDAAKGSLRSALRGHTGAVNAVGFAANGLLGSASDDGTVRFWDVATGATVATLVLLPEDGCAVLLPEGAYKLDGDPGDTVWWAMNLCRFVPGELDAFAVPRIRKLAPEIPIMPGVPR